MTTMYFHPRAGAVAALLAAAAVGPAVLPVASAQTPVAAEAAQKRAVAVAAPVFSTDLGRASVKPNPALTITYAVAATQPLSSAAVSQKLRFSIAEDGLREVTTATGEKVERQGSSSHYLTINTGKYKTVAQLKTKMAYVFRTFLAGGSGSIAGAELGKIGDARYGGEIHFVVESPEVLRCDYVPATTGESGFRFRRGDAQVFLNILDAAGPVHP